MYISIFIQYREIEYSLFIDGLRHQTINGLIVFQIQESIFDNESTFLDRASWLGSDEAEMSVQLYLHLLYVDKVFVSNGANIAISSLNISFFLNFNILTFLWPWEEMCVASLTAVLVSDVTYTMFSK